MYKPLMKLTKEQEDILEGKSGPVMAQIMETIVRYGDIFGAKRLIPVTHSEGHLVTSFGLGILTPLYTTMDKLIGANIKTKGTFSMDPRPYDFKNVKVNLLDRLIYSKILYNKQKLYESQLEKIGLRNANGFTCTPYLKEVNNRPKKGDVLSWAESSAVNFANSVLGARCNRNSGMIDLFGSILGYVPEFGLLTDEGRKATWKVYVKTSKLPEAQILGSAIGMKVVEDVPYVYGLDKFLGKGLNDETETYLKDFGAATASNGAVGLYHVDKITPEAVEQGEKLISKEVREYVIDDAELERVYASYPVMWKNKDANPCICFIGCPHCTFEQLNTWTDRIKGALKESGRKKVTVRTVINASPDVADKFRKTEKYKELRSTGVRLSSICPLMYTSNPLTKKRAIMTNSNKLRTYSLAKYYKDQDVLDILSGKRAK